MSSSYQKFFTNEVQAVRFGSRQDSTLTIIVILLSIVTCNAILITLLYTMLPKDIRDLWTTLRVYKTVFISNQQFVGVLLIGWVLSYNLVSLFIHSHYEQGEHYSSDDFYIRKFPMSQVTDAGDGVNDVNGGNINGNGINGNGNRAVHSETEPTLIIHPPHDHISLGIRKNA